MSFAWSDVALIWFGVAVLMYDIPRTGDDDGSLELVTIAGALTVLYLLGVDWGKP